MDLSPLQIVGGGAATGGVSGFFVWLGQRGKTRAYAQGAVDRAMTEALSGVSAQLKRTDERLAQVEDHHQKCTDDLREVQKRLDETEREREELRRQIDKLMAGPPATYDKGAMLRVGGK